MTGDRLNNGRFMVGEVGISAVTMAETLRRLDRRIRSGRPAYVCVANVRTTLLSQKDEEFCRAQNLSFMTLPDGMPLVWYARLAGLGGVERVTGPDLMTKALELSRQRGYSHCFLGDTEETLSKMAGQIRQRYPGAVVKGMRSPPFRPMSEYETDALIEEINVLRPTFTWVGLGAPKQERWMAGVIGRIDSSILIGVGAAFRFLIGQYRHPHRLIQKCGLEGVCWRFRSRPGQLLLRYCKYAPTYGWLVAKMLAGRTFSR